MDFSLLKITGQKLTGNGLGVVLRYTDDLPVDLVDISVFYDDDGNAL